MSNLRTYEAKPWPRIAGWLVPGDNCTELGYRIVQRLYPDIGIMERPLGSNWGKRISSIIGRFGGKAPEYWCGDEVGGIWADAGALVPETPQNCDNWLEHMKPVKNVDPIDIPGSAILFGKPGDAKHIEIVTRYELRPDRLILTGGGNKGIRGATGSNANNGLGVGMDILARADVLGLVVPTLRPDLSKPLPIDFK